MSVIKRPLLFNIYHTVVSRIPQFLPKLTIGNNYGNCVVWLANVDFSEWKPF